MNDKVQGWGKTQQQEQHEVRLFVEPVTNSRAGALDRVMEAQHAMNHEEVLGLPPKRVMIAGGTVQFHEKDEDGCDVWKIIWRVHLTAPNYTKIMEQHCVVQDLSWLEGLDEVTTKEGETT